MLEPSVRAIAALALFGTLTFAQDATPAPAPAASTPTPQVQEADTGIGVALLDLDGKTPLAGRKALLMNADTSDRIAEVESDEEGKFRLPELVNGSYVLTIDGTNYYFQISDERPLKTLKIMARGEGSGLQQVQNATTSVLFYVGAGVAVLLAGVTGGVIGYNLPDRTGTKPQAEPTPPVVFEAGPPGDYGIVVINTTREQTFVLRNISPFRAISGTITVSGTAFSRQTSGSFNLAPYATTSVDVQFAPTTVGTLTGTLTATYTVDGVTFTQTRMLTGQGVNASSVSPPGPP